MVRIAIIGTGSRATYMYGPLLNGMTDRAELVALWGRSEQSAERVGTALGVPWYTDIDVLIREAKPDIGIVCVNYGANGEVGRMAVDHGLNVLLETPIAHDLAEADAIIASAEKQRLKIEVAEQFHRRPVEQLKLRLIESGLFGAVHTAFSDFAGHGYHGVSVMRSYIGFDAQPVRAVGATGKYPMATHWSNFTGEQKEREETMEHGMVWFSNGAIAIFHWSSEGYDSGLRWWRSSRFVAENGLGITTGIYPHTTEQLSRLAPGAEGPQLITTERHTERCDGGALMLMKAHTGDPDMPVVTWENPFYRKPNGTTPQWHDDEIGVAGCILSLIEAVENGTEPTYGPYQARIDQEIVLAIRQSAENDGVPVTFPVTRT